MKTAQEITQALAELGMTDQEIADVTASSQPTIWRIRTGATTDCGVNLYIALVTLYASKRTRKAAGRKRRTAYTKPNKTL